MAGLTREQRAAKAAKLAAETVTSGAIANVEDIPLVKRETTPARTRLDAREYAEQIRSSRKDFSGLEQKLKYYGENPGWKRRWVNEENVPSREQEGYRFVLRSEVGMSDSIGRGNTDMGDRVSVFGGTSERGVPYNTYLMEIPQEIADEYDHEKSHKKVKLSEESIRAGTVGNPNGNTRTGAKDGLPEIKLS